MLRSSSQIWLRILLKDPAALRRPTPYQLVVGFITDFLDTLGIGSFATTTFLYRVRRVVADENITGTLQRRSRPANGHAGGLIYITIIQVEMKTLTLLIAASVVGAILGARVVTVLPRRAIQTGMGLALLAAAGFILSRLMQGTPEGGTATGPGGADACGRGGRKLRVRRPDDNRRRRLCAHHYDYSPGGNESK